MALGANTDLLMEIKSELQTHCFTKTIDDLVSCHLKTSVKLLKANETVSTVILNNLYLELVSKKQHV